jgi:4,5-DOPA dioxygenase extradiol
MLCKGDVDSLINYRSISKEAIRAHPSEEHLMPLFVAMGAAGKGAKAKAFYRGISDYVLAMDGYVFQS